MKKHLPVLLVAVLMTTFFQSCSHLTVLRTREIHGDRDSVRVRVDTLQKTLLDAQHTQEEMLRLIRADQQMHFAEIEKKVSDLDSRLSENQYRLSKIDEKTADFQKRLEQKLASDSIAVQSKSAEIEKLFQVAKGDFSAGRFDIAKNGFEDLVARFPDSPQGQEARYWVAECLYAKKGFEDAEKAYLLYIKNYPKGPQVCASLFKLGLCYESLKKNKSRDLVWKKLVEQYPDSQEAGIVKAKGK
jgi:tol-pal system protein YbgF